MVCPVTQPGATNRSVYLPGQKLGLISGPANATAGGQRVDAAAPIDTMPLFVRAGAILPMGPVVQYAAENRLRRWKFAFIAARTAHSRYMTTKATITTTKKENTQPFR